MRYYIQPGGSQQSVTGVFYDVTFTTKKIPESIDGDWGRRVDLNGSFEYKGEPYKVSVSIGPVNYCYVTLFKDGKQLIIEKARRGEVSRAWWDALKEKRLGKGK